MKIAVGVGVEANKCEMTSVPVESLGLPDEVDTNSEASLQRFKDDLAAHGVLNPKRLKGRYDFHSDTVPTRSSSPSAKPAS
jgi:hypothetical protein